MNKTTSILFFFFSILLFSCNQQTPIKKLITEWEFDSNSTRVIKTLNISTPIALTAKDSASILQKEYKRLKDIKFETLNTQLNEIEQRILATQNKINSTDNDLMKRAIKNRLVELDNKKNRCLGIIEEYTDSESENSLNKINAAAQNYLKNPKQIIAYKCKAELIIQQGLLPIDTVNYIYTFNLALDKVIAYYDN